MRIIKLATTVSLFAIALPATADQVILDDLIVDGSACIGQDCVNGESFGFDTIRIKENNLRIRAVDTSSTASFPSVDWQITFNDSSNGGANKFSIDDIDGGRTPFTIEAGARTNALYVEDGGRIGIGTSTPVADLHVKTGNTPTLRLEQDGTSGFTPQTWDVAGNEANFFIRDASNGSTLPFRVFPSAPSNALTIEGSSGDIGIGTTSPESSLHVRQTNNTAKVLIEDTSTGGGNINTLHLKRGAGNPIMRYEGTSTWDVTGGGLFSIINAGSPGNELTLNAAGNLTIEGTLTTAANNYPDYVFEDEYELMSLGALRAFIEKKGHLPNIPSEDDFNASGRKVNLSNMQMLQLQKIEELTLYTLAQEEIIDDLSGRIAALETAE